MDGAFIPDDAIIEDAFATKPIYSEKKKSTQKKMNIENRNKYKRENLNKLSETPSVWNIPYQIYYMSCNLDHILYGKFNSTNEEKENDAFAFAQKYKDDIPGFVKFITESPFSVADNYVKSWRYIREELHSLERHTNLGLCFKADNLIKKEK